MAKAIDKKLDKVLAFVANQLPGECKRIDVKPGEYKELDKNLGRGSYGIVSLAKHIPSGWKFAVKKTEANDKNRREIEIIKTLDHPRVVALFGFVEKEQELTMFLEYANNDTLKDKMSSALSEQQISFYLLQILDGLKYLHSMQIIHRDLKPENALIDIAGNVKLWSWCYMAPELFSDEPSYDYKADIWSVAVMTVEMLTGNLPLKDLEPVQIMSFYRYGTGNHPEYTLPKNVMPECEFFIESMLQKSSVRPTASQLLEDDPWLASWKEKQQNHISNVSLSDAQKILALQEIATSPNTETDNKLVSCLMMSATNLMMEETTTTVTEVLEEANVKTTNDADELQKFAKDHSSKGNDLLAVIVVALAVVRCFQSKTGQASGKINESVRFIVTNVFDQTANKQFKIIITQFIKHILTELHSFPNAQSCDVIRTSCNLSYCLHTIGNYNDMICTCEKAIALAKEKVEDYKYKRRVGALFNHYGVALKKSNRLTDALEAYAQALKIATSAADFENKVQRKTDIQYAMNNVKEIVKLLDENLL